MALTPETEAQILRYHHAERWPIGTIASQLHIHRDSVARVLAQAGLPTLTLVRRPSAIDPYLPFILETPNDHDGYAKEIALLRSRFQPEGGDRNA